MATNKADTVLVLGAHGRGADARYDQQGHHQPDECHGKASAGYSGLRESSKVSAHVIGTLHSRHCGEVQRYRRGAYPLAPLDSCWGLGKLPLQTPVSHLEHEKDTM